jgi:polyisoprenoid-binding protein YceI
MTQRFLLPLFAMMLTLPVLAVDTYKIDPVHSETSFRVRHLVSKVSGRFAKFEGTILVDNADMAKSSVNVTIDATSLSTDNGARDKHLASPDFFDSAKFPTLTFHSTAVKEVAKGKLEVTGQFTMHGVTRTITIPVTNLGTSAGMKPGTFVAGFEGALEIKRSEYGMSTYIPAVGDEVQITLNVEADKQ